MRVAGVLAVVGLLTIGSVAACGQPSPPSSGDRITVVTSTNVWASVVKAVGGDQVQVTAVVAGGDPHSYQVSARDAATLRGAQLVVYNGGGYDDWVEQSLGDGTTPPRLKVADVRPARIKADGNEHYWYDLPTVAQVAGELASRLAELRPSAKASFVANADEFDRRIDDLEAAVGRIAEAHAGKRVVVTEPVAHYLLDYAKLTDVTPAEFVDAVEEETDPPAAAVAQVQQVVSAHQAAVLVHNPQTETPVVTDLLGKARAAGIPAVDLTETLPDGQDYVTWMGKQIQALSDALGRKP
jgi:zinc/manganese transport system substrate-binding protein